MPRLPDLPEAAEPRTWLPTKPGAFPPPKLVVRRPRPPQPDIVVASVGGHRLTAPGCVGLLRQKRVSGSAAILREMGRTLDWLDSRKDDIFPRTPRFRDAIAGLSPKAVVLISRFGAMGDLIQLRAVLGEVRRRLGPSCPRFWLKTREPYASALSGRGVFERVLSRWPALEAVTRVLSLDECVEVDHTNERRHRKHRCELWWRYFAVR